jgi:site-specific DNA-cytosine methylase
VIGYLLGQMNPKDPRSQHVLRFLDLVEFYEPLAFCMENVRPLA